MLKLKQLQHLLKQERNKINPDQETILDLLEEIDIIRSKQAWARRVSSEISFR
jgi:hypothetical protein